MVTLESETAVRVSADVTNEEEDVSDKQENLPDITFRADLFGSTLGLLVYRDEKGNSVAQTMADYNQRYWQWLADVHVPEDLRPKQFPIIDRFIPGDSDRRALQEGIENLARAAVGKVCSSRKKLLRKIERARAPGGADTYPR